MREKRFEYYDEDFYDNGELMSDMEVLDILNVTDFIRNDILFLLNRLESSTMLGTGLEREFMYNNKSYNTKIEVKNIR